MRIKNNNICKDGIELYRKNESAEEDFVNQCYRYFDLKYPKFFKMDKMSKWGTIASHLLLYDMDLSGIDPYKRIQVYQNQLSSLTADILYQNTVNNLPSPALFVYTLPNIVMGEIAIKHNFKGENTFFVSEKKNPDSLMDQVFMLFESNAAELALCGYIDVKNESQDILLCSVMKKMSGNIFSIEQIEAIYHQS